MKGFTFFENFFDSISDVQNGLSAEQEGMIYRAILYYVFRGEELPLEGAARMAFNLIRPSLDVSRKRSGARNGKTAHAEESGKETEEGQETAKPGEHQTQIKTQSKHEQTQIKSENLTFLEETETEIRDETLQRAPAREGDGTEDAVPHAPSREEIEGRIAAYKRFLSEHPDIVADLVNPDDITAVDWALLGEKIGESRILKPKRSLLWLVKNYTKIIHDAYKDYPPGESPRTAASEEARRREEFLRTHHWVEGT